MSVRVKLPTILRKHAGGEALVDAEGATLRDLLSNLESRYPGITKNIVADDGGLHRFINVYVNDEDVRYLGALETSVNEGDTVSILPAVAGGRAQAADPEDPASVPEQRPPHQGEIVRTTS
jgi:molybdopterin synthase sulfur carrier subunit